MATGDDDTFLDDPDQVAENGYMAFLSALWFYMLPQTPKPSMHEVATHLYYPNVADVASGLGSVFGSATMIINGGLECTTESGEENSNSLKRIEYYKAFLSYFGLPEETGLGCATMQPFSTSSSSNYPQSLDRNWNTTDECKVASWYTQFTIFEESDYKRCVCFYFASDLEGCLNGDMARKEDELEVAQI